MGEGKIIDINKGRKKLNYKKIISVLKFPVIILAVIAALLISARLVGKVATSNITDSFRQIKTAFSKGEGFPYSIEGFEVEKVEAIGNRVMFLTQDNSFVLDKKAGELFRTQLDAENTKLITHNGRALLYSNNSSKVVLQSKTEELGTVDAGGMVVTATLAQNGWFATAHTDNQNRSVLTVYNNRFEKEFVWNCAEERIAALALAPDGKNVAVSAIGVKNAEVYSRVLIFNTKETKPVYDSNVSGTLLLRMFYPSKKAIIAVGDNKTVVFDAAERKIKEQFEYAENGLLFAQTDEKGNVAVCISDSGGFESKIYVFKKDASKLCTIEVTGKPEALDVGSNKVVYALNSELIVCNLKGEEKERIKVSGNVEKVLICSGDFFTVEGKKICKYN